ncbi:MAG: glycosyltransferase family 4 protein [Candidatus Omnitrophota bacterium]
MRLLFVPYGTEQAPATRYRVMQYIPHLKARGIECRVFSAISRFSTSVMIMSPDFAPPAKFLYYLYIFVERLFRLLAIIAVSARYDAVFLQRTTFPMRLELLLRLVNPRIIFDIDDAIYLPDKKEESIIGKIKKYVKKSEVVHVLRVSRCVIIENEYIGSFVSNYCGNVFKIPGPIDTDRFSAGERQGRQAEVVIGWIGSPATTVYLHMLDRIFKELASKYGNLRFRFIGIGRYDDPGVPFERIAWSYDTEVKELRRFDIGVMPMPDDEWTKGKLGCKMLQYMSVGIPAVVSYTPTNAEIIKDGENGFFVKSGEWTEVLSPLIEDGSLRRRIGARGRETILDKCSLTGNTDVLVEIVKKMAA